MFTVGQFFFFFKIRKKNISWALCKKNSSAILDKGERGWGRRAGARALRRLSALLKHTLRGDYLEGPNMHSVQRQPPWLKSLWVISAKPISWLFVNVGLQFSSNRQVAPRKPVGLITPSEFSFSHESKFLPSPQIFSVKAKIAVPWKEKAVPWW